MSRPVSDMQEIRVKVPKAVVAHFAEVSKSNAKKLQEAGIDQQADSAEVLAAKWGTNTLAGFCEILLRPAEPKKETPKTAKK